MAFRRFALGSFLASIMIRFLGPAIGGVIVLLGATVLIALDVYIRRKSPKNE